MSRNLARLKYPAFALVAGAVCVVALYALYYGARVTSPEAPPNQPAVRADDVASGSRSAAVEAAQAAPANTAQVSRSRSATMQASQAAPPDTAQVSKTRTAAMPATQAAPSNTAQVSRSRTAAPQAGQAAPSNPAQVSRTRSGS